MESPERRKLRMDGEACEEVDLSTYEDRFFDFRLGSRRAENVSEYSFIGCASKFKEVST